MDHAVIRTVAIAAFVGFLLPLPSSAVISASASVNAVLGDESFIQAFGCPPGPDTDEDLRIRTHLEYVEALLAARDVSSWPAELQAARRINLGRLHEYRVRGVFPRNYDFSGMRKPCFIDREGRICAAGYLIERSVGRQVAEVINAQFQYALIEDIHSRGLATWIAQSGLTRREVAMIQPKYGDPPTLCMRMTGSTWSSSGPAPGAELHLVGTISPTDGMFSHYPVAGELTFYLGPMVLTDHREWNDSDWYYYGGAFAVYEDSSSSAELGMDPPNTTSPGTFTDGLPLFAGGNVSLLVLVLHSQSSDWWSLSARLWVEESDPRFRIIYMDIEGALSPAGVPGYDFSWVGEAIGHCGFTPVEAVTWGGIKAHYR